MANKTVNRNKQTRSRRARPAARAQERRTAAARRRLEIEHTTSYLEGGRRGMSAVSPRIGTRRITPSDIDRGRRGANSFPPTTSYGRPRPAGPSYRTRPPHLSR